MLKKMLVILCALTVFTTSSMVPVMAKSLPPVKIVLTDNLTGKKTQLQAETVSIERFDPGHFAVISEIAVPAPMLGIGTTTNTKTDSNISVRTTITQYYTDMVVAGQRYVSVQKYTAKWTLLDSTVQWSGAYLFAGCWGEPYSGSPAPCQFGTSVQTAAFTPTNNTTYQLVPSWANRYWSVNDDYNQAGKASINLKRGTAKWTFQLCVQQGLTADYTC